MMCSLLLDLQGEQSPAVYNYITLDKPHTGNLTMSEPHMGD